MDSIWEACQRHGYGISASSVIKFTANNSRFASSSATEWCELSCTMGTQALLVRLGNSEPVAKAGKRRGKRNDAPKMLNRFGMVDFLSPPLNGFMFGATLRHGLTLTRQWAQLWVIYRVIRWNTSVPGRNGLGLPQIHPTWVRNGRNKFVLFRFFPPTCVIL